MKNINKDIYVNIFTENVTYLRKVNNISLKEMSKILNISTCSMKKIEKGILPPTLKVDVLFKIQEHLWLGTGTSRVCSGVRIRSQRPRGVLLSAHLQVDGKHSSEAALILHRKGFDCRFSSRDTGLLCSTTQGKVSRRPVLPVGLV